MAATFKETGLEVKAEDFLHFIGTEEACSIDGVQAGELLFPRSIS